jgi:hypothetical protein
MTKDELFQKLSEVAEFRMPKLTASDIKISKQKARGKGRPSKEELYQDEHEEVFLDMFQGINPTMNPELVKVNVQPVDCEDCGRHCENGRQQEIKFYKKTVGHIAHRRTRCLTCNKYRDPNTGEYTLPQGPACQVYLNWAKAEFNARNKLAKAQGKPETKIEIREPECVIRKYPDTLLPHK